MDITQLELRLETHLNRFADLYNPDNVGAWLSHRQGLSIGMDLHDFIIFVARACDVISDDANPFTRCHKAQRLLAKMNKVHDEAWAIAQTPYRVRSIIKQSQYEIEAWYMENQS